MKTNFLIFLIFYTSFCFAQSDKSAADSLPEKSTLTLAAVYSNNASYYGQKAVENTPYAAIAAHYQFKSGFYFTGQTYKLLNDETSTPSAGSLGAGVNFKLGKKLVTDLSYRYSLYARYSPFLQASNPHNASLSLSFPAWITTSLTGDYAFGETNDAFVTGAISRQISLFSLGKKDIITLTPSADVVGGTQHFYQTYLREKSLRDSLLGILPLPGQSGSNHTDTTVTTSFNLLSYNLKLPLAYNRSQYALEAAWQLSLLSNQAQTANGKVNSFLTFSFYYQF